MNSHNANFWIIEVSLYLILGASAVNPKEIPDILQPKKYFRHFHEKKIYHEFRNICRLLGYYGNILLLLFRNLCANHMARQTLGIFKLWQHKHIFSIEWFLIALKFRTHKIFRKNDCIKKDIDMHVYKIKLEQWQKFCYLCNLLWKND